jgi:predicted transposase YdaD
MLVTEWDFERKLSVVGEEHYQTGLSEGRAEGRTEGRSQERHDNVWNLYYQGYSVEAIAKGLKLSEQEVKDILGQS